MSKRKRIRLPIASRSADVVNRAVFEALDRRPHDQFFLYLHYMDVHDNALKRDTYVDALVRVDRALGEVLRWIEEEQLRENSVIVFTSDHGHRLGEKHVVSGTHGHGGNPSFEEMLRVPLIVSPPRFENTTQVTRSEDVFRMITDTAGLHPAIPEDLARDELFLTEKRWQTYRKGRWKSFMRRKDEELYLIDLDSDAGETRDVSAEYPLITKSHRERIAVLGKKLAAEGMPRKGPTLEDEARLRALGYLE